MNPYILDNALPPLDSPIIVALDYPNEQEANTFLVKINPQLCQIKIGNELFTSSGRKFVESLINRGYKVFLDLKYYDIPNTVQQACKVAADMGVWMVNVHASGGRKMLEAALEGLSQFSIRPLLIGVTVLTSMSAVDLAELNITNTLDNQIIMLATLSHQCGLDGVVCSAHEVSLIKHHTEKKFLTITPGIRLADSVPNDQKRITTPQSAIEMGSDYLVIGRPITQHPSPTIVINQINQFKNFPI